MVGHSPTATATTVTVVPTATVTAAQLNTINAATTLPVTATAVTLINASSYADIATVYAANTAGTITGLGNEAITPGVALTVAQANSLAGFTTGLVTATISDGDIATLSGLVSDTAADGTTAFPNALTITVTGINDPPTSTAPPTIRAMENQRIRIQSKTFFDDPDPSNTTYGQLTYSVSGLPAGLSINDAGRINGRLPEGTYTFTVTATDGGNLSTTQTFTIIVGKRGEKGTPPPPPVIVMVGATVYPKPAFVSNIFSTDFIPALSVVIATAVASDPDKEFGDVEIATVGLLE